MKRYMSSIILVCVSIIIIGAYYGKMMVSANNFPEYSIKTLEGREGEIKDVTLSGFVEKDGRTNSVKITSNETLYQSEQSYLQRLTGNNDPKIEKLKKEHRSFMRGQGNIHSFYQDSDFIAYAEADYKSSSIDHSYKHAFNIGLLDLASDKDISFEMSVPGEIFNHISVLDVQLIQSKLKVVTKNYIYTNTDVDDVEVHVYTFDLGNQKLLNDEVIITPQQIKMGYDVLDSMGLNPQRPRNSIVFIKRPEVVNQSEESASNTDKAAILEYVYEKNHLETIELPETLETRIVTSQNYLIGDKLYIINQDAKGMHVTTFNITNQSITNDQTFPINNNNWGGAFPIVIKNDRVYVLATNDFEKDNTTNMPPQLFIAELKTGGILYKGEVIPKKADKKINTKPLVLHSLEIN